MNYKRGKSKRKVRCTMCTDVRWRGNRAGRFKAKDEAKVSRAKKEIKGDEQ